MYRKKITSLTKSHDYSRLFSQEKRRLKTSGSYNHDHVITSSVHASSYNITLVFKLTQSFLWAAFGIDRAVSFQLDGLPRCMIYKNQLIALLVLPLLNFPLKMKSKFKKKQEKFIKSLIMPKNSKTFLVVCLVMTKSFKNCGNQSQYPLEAPEIACY